MEQKSTANLGQGSKKGRYVSDNSVKRLYTLKEAAAYLGRTVDGLREVIWAGKLPVVRDGRKQWVDIRDLDAFVERFKSYAA